jgi:YihY family inner membrane protein
LKVRPALDVGRRIDKLDRFQQRRPWLALPFAIGKKFGDDQAGSLAALIAYYGFFSLFPLLLVFVTVLGFVLQNNPSLQKSVEENVLAQFPGLGFDPHTLTGSGVSLAIGIIGSLWGGLAVTSASQTAFDKVWAVPRKQRTGFFASKLRGVATLALLGILFVVSTAASGLVAGGLTGAALTVAGLALSLLLNLALFFAAFRLLTTDVAKTHDLIPGIVVASILWEILQALGGIYVDHVVRQAQATYGTFAVVIGLLSWLYLGAQVVLFSAEINVVRARHLWPRSIRSDPVTEGDEQALTALAKVEEQIDAEHIEVHFDPGGAHEA